MIGTPETPIKPDRDAGGRFKPGVVANRNGNPTSASRRTLSRVRSSVTRQLTQEDIDEIGAGAIKRAKASQVGFVQFLQFLGWRPETEQSERVRELERKINKALRGVQQ